MAMAAYPSLKVQGEVTLRDHWSIRLLAIWIALCCSLTPVDAFGAERGAIAGTILDEVGGPLPGARVEIAGPVSTDSTDSQGMGFFHFAGVKAGNYTITASHPNFASVTQRIVVHPGETMRMSMQLRRPKPGP